MRIACVEGLNGSASAAPFFAVARLLSSMRKRDVTGRITQYRVIVPFQPDSKTLRFNIR
jgi:hypothetical protein